MAIESVDKLQLDPLNPRLPEELQGEDQHVLFEYLYDNAVLDELADSMMTNGFFAHEPLIVLPPQPDGMRIVLEGNRRLAALMLIRAHPAARGKKLSVEPTEEQIRRLATVPIFEVENRDDVDEFLGYRHISGLQPWGPEAKARYIEKHIQRAVHKRADNAFAEVARQVGSNSQTVRTYFSALSILRTAHTECGVDVKYVLNDRFGVWMRCMSSAEVRGYIGFGNPRRYEEVVTAVHSLDCEKTREVLGDLSLKSGQKRPVLADSRDVTQYGLVLVNPQAHALLRKYDDLEIARQVVIPATIANRIEGLQTRVDALRSEIEQSVENVGPDVVAAGENLTRSVKLLTATLNVLKVDE